MNHKRVGFQHNGHKAIQKSKEHDKNLIERYLTAKALLATHEASPNPDYVYIKKLEHRRDTLRKQVINNGLL